jgi:hypothetical protein
MQWLWSNELADPGDGKATSENNCTLNYRRLLPLEKGYDKCLQQ